MDSLPLTRFSRMLEEQGEHIDLAEAALLIAAREYPQLNIPYYLNCLDAMAARARSSLPEGAGDLEVVAVLNRVLFDEEGFAGNAEEYYDPRNSYLNEVIERRLGIPISLSIIYLAVGRRLGLPLEGISFPGHFLVKLVSARGDVVLDPFIRGQVLAEADVNQRLRDLYTVESPPIPAQQLGSAGAREILARLLRNLKGIYLHQEKFSRALYAVNCLLVVAPDSQEEVRDRGRIYERLECFRAALDDYQNYLELDPAAPDARSIRARLPHLKKAAARLN